MHRDLCIILAVLLLGCTAKPPPPTVDLTRCDPDGLEWKTANKTRYTSYPEPGSEECVEFNGCTWEGLFAGCDGKQSEDWVASHNIAAVFPDFGRLAHHELCLRSGDARLIVTVIDTCADSDCDGCCTTNQGTAELLIDLESYTDARWGLPDGPLEWTDLGPADAASDCQQAKIPGHWPRLSSATLAPSPTTLTWPRSRLRSARSLPTTPPRS